MCAYPPHYRAAFASCRILFPLSRLLSHVRISPAGERDIGVSEFC